MTINFTEMKAIIRDLNLDLAAHAAGFRQQWDVTGSNHHARWQSRSRPSSSDAKRRKNEPRLSAL
jgi:hypothetical protein